MELLTELWDEARFGSAEAEWQELLAHSDADPLFLSWPWMHGWWQQFRVHSEDLLIIAVRDGGKLVGLAPLHRHRARYLKGWLPVQRIEFLGCCCGQPSGLLSEYLDFILHRDHRQAALQQLLDALDHQGSWQELLLHNVPSESPLSEALPGIGKRRELDRQSAYPIDTRGHFGDYLASLGRNTRLKLYNRRKLLDSLGPVELRPVDEDGIDELIDRLNDFDRLRFGHESTMNAATRSQLKRLQACMPELSIGRHSSLLCLDGEPISVVINFSLGRTIYNMQLGYRERFHKKISLGTLHLGYALEAAFEDPGIDCFDLLLGGGKNSDYKRHLSPDRREAASWQVMRSPLLKTLFAINDNGKRLIRRFSAS